VGPVRAVTAAQQRVGDEARHADYGVGVAETPAHRRADPVVVLDVDVNHRARTGHETQQPAGDGVARTVSCVDDADAVAADVAGQPEECRGAAGGLHGPRDTAARRRQRRSEPAPPHAQTPVDPFRVRIWLRGFRRRTGQVHVEARAVEPLHDEHVDEGVRPRLLGRADEEHTGTHMSCAGDGHDGLGNIKRAAARMPAISRDFAAEAIKVCPRGDFYRPWPRLRLGEEGEGGPWPAEAAQEALVRETGEDVGMRHGVFEPSTARCNSKNRGGFPLDSGRCRRPNGTETR
jgi:hypothetical protein